MAPFKRRGLVQRILGIVRPFEYEWRRGQPIEDAFFFPQRLIVAVLIGLLAFLFFAIKMIVFALDLIKR